MLSLSQQCGCYNHALSGTVAIVTKLLLVDCFEEVRRGDKAVQCCMFGVHSLCGKLVLSCFTVIEIPVIHHTVNIHFHFFLCGS